MKKALIALIYFLAASSMPILSAAMHRDIGINNCVLTKINGKAITVLDVANKLENIFRHEFPEHIDDTKARYEFYMANWHYILQEMVNKELILADARDKKMVVGDADIREELEEMFGSNAVQAVSQLGMTYQEAWAMIKEDITVRRMMLYYVHSRAAHKTSPQDIRNAFEDYISDNPQHDEWDYRVISIRDNDGNLGLTAATIAHLLLTEKKVSLDDLVTTLTADSLISSTTEIKISNPFHHADNVLSEPYKKTLSSLEIGSYSAPVQQQGNAGKAPLYRIFYLKNHIIPRKLTLSDIEEQLKDRLYAIAMAEESERYMAGLRKRYGIDAEKVLASIPERFVPFVL